MFLCRRTSFSQLPFNLIKKTFAELIFIYFFCQPAIAQEFSSTAVKLFPNFNEISLNDLGTFLEDGEIGTEFNQIVGRDISRSFKSGDKVEDVLQIGDLQASLALQEFSLNDIDSRVAEPNDFSALPLSDFPLVEEQTLENLVDAVLDLGALTPNEVEPIRVLLERENINYGASSPLKNLVNNPAIGSLNLGMLEQDFAIDSIPNLTDTPLENFENFETTTVSEVPGLADVPLSQFPNEIPIAGTFIARIDFIWGGAESHRYRTISGSYLEGFNVPCQSNCEYLELDDLENIGAAVQFPFEGKQWIAGREHYVFGGSGCLKGREPTGIHPFGKIFKVVLWRTDETSDRALIVLFFNFSTFCGESPYIIGPVFIPFGLVEINDYIFIGTD